MTYDSMKKRTNAGAVIILILVIGYAFYTAIPNLIALQNAVQNISLK
jgi:hypothetical protein